LTALVWIAGPFCGAFIQPVVGYFSDKSRLSLGQRRPYIIFGAVSTIFSILLLAWTENNVRWFVDVTHLEVEKEAVADIVIGQAVFWIYVLNISIQPLQIGLRALVIENCPSDQQAQANVWASLMTGAGNIFGYLVGFAPLPAILEGLVQTRFQGLCIIASIALTMTVPITCCFVHERNPETLLLPTGKKSGLGTIASRLLRTFRTMPFRIRKVLQIQFFAWMGWFPYLFYATT
jgi:solute carrier family 45 protein 1/2/4